MTIPPRARPVQSPSPPPPAACHGDARHLVSQCYRWSGIGARVPKGALVQALRHTFATRLAEDGASATGIQRLLGHESLNTNQGYIDSTASGQRAAAPNRTYQTLLGIVDTTTRQDWAGSGRLYDGG